MLQPSTVASPEAFAVLVVCILGIAFMVRFFIALACDENKIRVTHTVRTRGVQRGKGVVCGELLLDQVAAYQAGHLALGVMRITTALASNSSQHGATARPGTRVRDRAQL